LVMAQPFRIPVTRNYPFSERRGVCERLGELIDELVLGAMPLTERAGSGGRMILGSWARAHTTYGAIIVLANEEEPDGQTVVMLSRPLFETMVDLYWIARNPLKAQDLAMQNYRLLRIVIPEHYNRSLKPGDREMPINPADLADRETHARTFGTKAQKHWTTLDLRARAKAVNEDVPQDTPGELDDRFDEDHHFANLVLHGSPMTINDRLNGTAGRLTVQLAPPISIYRMVCVMPTGPTTGLAICSSGNSHLIALIYSAPITATDGQGSRRSRTTQSKPQAATVPVPVAAGARPRTATGVCEEDLDLPSVVVVRRHASELYDGSGAASSTSRRSARNWFAMRLLDASQTSCKRGTAAKPALGRLPTPAYAIVYAHMFASSGGSSYLSTGLLQPTGLSTETGGLRRR
jgi:hypothetical protein